MDLRNLLLPGGIGLRRIKVYEQPGPDGVIGGGAHFHSVSAESYYVVSGYGELELLSYSGFEVLKLEPNMVIYFQPGVIHRVCNPNKNLVILSIMQNGGVAERTDFFLTFPMDIIADARSYQQAMRSKNLTEALARRDLSIKGYRVLREAMENEPAGGRELLEQLLHCGCTTSAGCLIGSGDDPPYPVVAMQRPQRDECDDRRAIRVCNDSPMFQRRFRIDLGDNQRNIRIHSESRTVVDHNAAAFGGNRCIFFAYTATGGKKGYVCTAKTVFIECFNSEVTIAALHLASD